MAFVIFLVLSVAVVCGFIGIYFGVRLQKMAYHGFMFIEETPQGLKYRLELAGDPELLVFQESVSFLVVAPNYEELNRGGN
jgi:hypothetical protein